MPVCVYVYSDTNPVSYWAAGTINKGGKLPKKKKKKPSDNTTVSKEVQITCGAEFTSVTVRRLVSGHVKK